MSGWVNNCGQPYAAAQNTRLTAKMRSRRESAKNELQYGTLATLRARCDGLYKDNALARGAVDTIVRRTVGAGLEIYPAMRDDKGKMDSAANTELRALHDEFERDISVDGHKGHRYRKLLVRTFIIGGEVFEVQTDQPDLPFSLRWQMMEGDQLPEANQKKGGSGIYDNVPADNHVEMGIEKNEFGRKIAYHFYADGGDCWSDFTSTRKTMRIPADRVLHWCNGERYGSPRGVPMLTPVVLLLADDKEFVDATLTKAWVQACLVMALSSKNPELTAHRTGVHLGSAQEKNDPSIPETSRNGQVALQALGHGVVLNLDDGTDVTSVQSTAPSTGIAEFESVIHHSIAAGLGMSYQLFSRNLKGVSYSGGRQGDNEDRLMFADMSLEMDEELFSPMWRTFVDYVYHILQMIPVPDVVNIYAVNIHHPVPPAIDPVKDAVSNEKNLLMGATSLQRIAAKNGNYLPEVAAELAEEKALFESLGLTVSAASTPVTLVLNDEQNEEGDDDGEE